MILFSILAKQKSYFLAPKKKEGAHRGPLPLDNTSLTAILEVSICQHNQKF